MVITSGTQQIVSTTNWHVCNGGGDTTWQDCEDTVQNTSQRRGDDIFLENEAAESDEVDQEQGDGQ